MASTSTTEAQPTPAAFGFHCNIIDADFVQAVARVAHEVHGRLERVRAALVEGAGSARE